MTERFDAGGFLVRLRRLADLSQRGLAARAGLSQSAVAAYEADRCDISAQRLDELLRIGGLRLAVLDAEGAEVAPFPEDTVRDNAGRRFPAHLDVQPPDVLPAEALRGPRYDRMPAVAWHHHRAERDRIRAAAGAASAPADHPTVPELAERARSRVLARLEVAWARAASGESVFGEPRCSCALACWETPGCVPGCPCGCEAGK